MSGPRANGKGSRSFCLHLVFPLDPLADKEDFKTPKSDLEIDRSPWVQVEFSGAFDRDGECP